MEDPHSASAESSQTPEGTLVARAREGDAAAFRILVDRHANRAYGLALRLLRSEPDAEEVAQDAFVRAWKSLRTFRGDASFSTWIYRIVWRQALDRSALLRSRRERESPLDVASLEREGSKEVGFQDQWSELTTCLSEVQRAVVTLFYYQDQSVKAVARTLELPEGTVKTHLSRARALLRARYRKPGGSEESMDAL